MDRVPTSTFFRLSGFALLLALPVQIVGWLMHPASEQLADLLTPLQGPAHLVQFVSWFLIVLGLPGLYACQSERAGHLGMVGFVASMLSRSRSAVAPRSDRRAGRFVSARANHLWRRPRPRPPALRAR